MTMTRLRAGPRSMAAMFAFTAILAASAALLVATPVQAAAATTLKFQQYNEAPAINQATTDAYSDNVLGAANDFKTAARWINDAKMIAKNSSNGPRAAPQMAADNHENFGSMNPATPAG